ARIFHRQVAPWAIGAETSDIGGLITTIEEREHKYPGSYRCRALPGLDRTYLILVGVLLARTWDDVVQRCRAARSLLAT
ncbi:MAG TPA: hypothetical protein VF940_33805, partial [Streptosporangiaceae bacterium]